MHRLLLSRSGVCVALMAGTCILVSVSSLAQGLPKAQPKVLTIIREHVKVGRASVHGKFEAGYPAALEKAKSPDYYLALTSMSGPSEAWYLMPQESFAAIDAGIKRDDKDPVLSAEMSRLDLADAENINAVETIRARARPELGAGAYPDVTRARFFEIGVYRVKPGREQLFEKAGKAFSAALLRVAPKASIRVYEVLAGMPLPTYLVITSMESYAEYDQRLLEGDALFKQATPEEMAQFEKWGDCVERVENNHFRVDPGSSYVPREAREKDPAFWLEK